MVEFTHPADFAVPPHVHHDADEAFYILEGAARGFCGEDQWHATAGDFVWLPRGVPHAYAADRDAGTLRTLAITVPTGFEQFVREAGEPAPERVLPPPSELDIPKLVALSAKYGAEFVDAPPTLSAEERTPQPAPAVGNVARPAPWRAFCRTLARCSAGNTGSSRCEISSTRRR